MFTVLIPASTEQVSGADKPDDKPLPRRCRILVMDDEDIVREVAGELIRAVGHDPEFAEHGEAALAVYQEAMSAGRPFDLVVLDLTIRGGMGGQETMQKLLELDKGVRAIVSSGYSDDEAMADYLGRGFRAFLKKPYKMDDLNRVINEVMTGG